MIEKILNNTTPYGKIRASHEGSLHSSTLKDITDFVRNIRDIEDEYHFFQSIQYFQSIQIYVNAIYNLISINVLVCIDYVLLNTTDFDKLLNLVKFSNNAF